MFGREQPAITGFKAALSAAASAGEKKPEFRNRTPSDAGDKCHIGPARFVYAVPLMADVLRHCCVGNCVSIALSTSSHENQCRPSGQGQNPLKDPIFNSKERM